MEAPHSENVSAFRKHGLSILFAALAPMFTGAAYLTGQAYSQTYLHVFHVPASLVSVSTADHFVYAYFAVNFLIQSVFKSLILAAAIAGLIFWAAFQWLLMDSLSNRTGPSWFSIIVQRWFHGRFWRVLRRFVFLPTAITVVIIYLILFITIILIIPVKLGGTAGRLQAQEDIAAYRKGCNKPVETKFCNLISEGGKQVVNGYVISGSEKNVVVFDGTTTFIFARGDKTTIAEAANK